MRLAFFYAQKFEQRGAEVVAPYKKLFSNHSRKWQFALKMSKIVCCF